MVLFGAFSLWQVVREQERGLNEVYQKISVLSSAVDGEYLRFWGEELSDSLAFQVMPETEIRAMVTADLNGCRRSDGEMELAVYDENWELLAQTGGYLTVSYEVPPTSEHRKFGKIQYGLLNLYDTLPREAADKIVDYCTGAEDPEFAETRRMRGMLGAGYDIAMSAIWTDGETIIPETIYVYKYPLEPEDGGYCIPLFDEDGTMISPGTMEIVYTYENQPEPSELQDLWRISGPHVLSAYCVTKPEDTPARAAVLDQEQVRRDAEQGLWMRENFIEQDGYGQMTASGLLNTSYYCVWNTYLLPRLNVGGVYSGPCLAVAGVIHPLRDSAGVLAAVGGGSLGLFLLVGLILCWQLGRVVEAQAALEERRRRTTNAIAHDLKTPMAAITGYAENLLEGTRPDKEEHYLQAIRGQVGRMNEIVKQMLELGRLEAETEELQRTEFSLSELCREAAEDLGGEDWRYLVTGEAVVSADREQLRRVLDNLLGNAKQHTPPGGVVNIDITPYRLEIRNPGPPIPEEQLPRLWEPYYRGNDARTGAGSGLGLSIVREILQRHGFQYGAENRGSGVVFWFDWESCTKL